MTYKQAKARLTMFRIIAVLCALCTVTAIGTFLFSNYLSSSAYNAYISISPASEHEERIASYLKAISLSPKNMQAYMKLAEAYGEDGLFTKKESELFLAQYNRHHNQFNTKDAQYAVLHYSIGFLFLNGYEDTNTTARLRRALPFMEEAAQYLPENDPNRLAVDCYCRIGNYYKNYIWDASAATKEVSASQMQGMVAEIQSTLAAFRMDTSENTVYNSLGFSTAVCNLLYDQRDTLAATVPEQQVTDILDAIYGSLPKAELVRNQQTKDMIAALEANEQHYRDMVLRAYQRGGAG